MRRKNPCAISMRVEWDIDQHNPAFAGDRLHRIGAVNRFGNDAGSRYIGPARIQNQHRDVAFDRRNHGRRMKHLGPEIGKFGGFGEGDGLDAM